MKKVMITSEKKGRDISKTTFTHTMNNKQDALEGLIYKVHICKVYM